METQTEILNHLRGHSIGFDPAKLLAYVEFPLDKFEAVVHLHSPARNAALFGQDLSKDPDYEHVKRNPVLYSQLQRIAAALVIQSNWKTHRTQLKYTHVRFGDVSLATPEGSTDAGELHGSGLQGAQANNADVTSDQCQVDGGVGAPEGVQPRILQAFGDNAASHEQFLAQLQIQERTFQKYTHFCILCESLGRVPPFYDEFCALKLQATWHCYRAQKALKATLESFAQARARGVKATNYLAQEHERYSVSLLRKNRDVAASRIQRMWRRFWYRKVFLFLRDLIRARESSDCRSILKVINPRESQLVDSAAGVHIRFRLGGTDFPPTLYYKVFVHRPTIDIGAFAPRNYVNPCDPRKETCYRRFENNGWRPVLQQPEPYEIFNDSVYLKSTSVRVQYPPLPKQRREEKEKLKKQKRVEWMRKLYHLNMSGPSEDPETDSKRSSQLPRHDSVTFDETDGPEDVLVWWASALDFEQYSKDWAVLATAATFETQKQGRNQAGQAIIDELGEVLGAISPSVLGEEEDDQDEFGVGILSPASSRASSAKQRDVARNRTSSPGVLPAIPRITPDFLPGSVGM